MKIDKIGRNDPCPCGKLRVDGKPMKYKKCHGFDHAKSMHTITISRADFIGEPITECPSCHQLEFGVFVSTGGTNSFTKECRKCSHEQTYPLPPIRKRIIYLDQFVIDNIVKSLDPKHPKHNVAITDPFWIQVFTKLDALSRAQLIICPDSFFHRDESGPTGYFKFMQRIYEHFSGGATFTNHIKICGKSNSIGF